VSTGTGDLLLRWISERAVGRNDALLSGVGWLARAHGNDSSLSACYAWIGLASALGHLDVDWKRRRWSAAPLVLTALPFSDGLAVLAGARTAHTQDAVAKAAADWLELTEVPDASASGGIPAPHSFLVTYDTPDDLPEFAQRLNATYAPCFALQAVGLLPTLALGEEDVAPAASAAVRRFDERQGALVDVPTADRPGLYRARRTDGVSYLYTRDGSRWYRTTRPEGIYLALAESSRSVLRWQPEAARGRARIGTLRVPGWAPLPPLQQRVAALCLGVPPMRTFRETAYRNVPRILAERLARSLDQRLSLEPQPGQSQRRSRDDYVL